MSTMVHAGSVPAIQFGDRCDRACPAPARVRVKLSAGAGLLDFCKHHFEAQEAALRARASDILDERHLLDIPIERPIPVGMPVAALRGQSKGGTQA